MKKLRTTLFVCLTALAVLTAFGCKQTVASTGDDTKKWSGTSTPNANVIEIECDKGGEISWGAVFTEQNVLVSEIPLKPSGTTPKYSVEVPGPGKYNVYIHQPNAEIEASKATTTAGAESMDFRGLVEVKSGNGTLVKASKAPQRVNSVGMVTITNNEKSGSSTWQGNYGVKKVKAVKQDEKDPNKWIEVDGYTVTAPDGEYLVEQATENGSTSQKILFPYGSYYVAVNQPDRLEKTSDTIIVDYLTGKGGWFSGDGETPLKDPMFTGYETGKNAIESVEAYKEYQENAFWVQIDNILEVPKHATATKIVTTGNNDGYLSPDNVATDGRYAAPAVYEIVEAPAGER